MTMKKALRVTTQRVITDYTTDPPTTTTTTTVGLLRSKDLALWLEDTGASDDEQAAGIDAAYAYADKRGLSLADAWYEDREGVEDAAIQGCFQGWAEVPEGASLRPHDMGRKFVSAPDLRFFLMDLMGPEADEAVANVLASRCWGDGDDTEVALSLRWKTDDDFFAEWAKAAAEPQASWIL